MTGCYILFSEKLKKYYVGVTQEDIDTRTLKHNTHFYGNHRFTAQVDDWELFLFIPTTNFAQAVRIERKKKSMKSTQYIKNLVKYPELIQRLVSST